MLEHFPTVEWDELDSECYVHAQHCWMPISAVVTSMKVDTGHFARKFLNAHQVYDTTSWDWHVYITFATAFTSLSANQKLALLWLYRAWFNDFARYVVWQKVLFSSDLDPEEWLSDSAVCKSLLQSRSLDLNKLTAKQMARTLFMETAIAGKQPDRGYIKGTYCTESGHSKIFQVATIFVDTLRGASRGEQFGDYSIYKFMVGVDCYDATLLSNAATWPSLDGKTSAAAAQEPMSFVGPGCPQHFPKIAYSIWLHR